MQREMLLAFLSLISAGVLLSTDPVLAEKGERERKEGTSGKIKTEPALGVNLLTGDCQVREIAINESDAPLGFKLLGRYKTEEQAEAAGRSRSECRDHVVMSKEERPGERAAASACTKEVNSTRSSVVGLLSRLYSAADDQTLFVACMKAHGYATDRQTNESGGGAGRQK